MTVTHEINRFETSFARRIARVLDALRQQRTRRAVYRNTYDELSALSGRELADLGIARSDVAAIARRAAQEV